MKVEPYLFFNGRCDEALAFYTKTLGAQVSMLMRFDESPEPCPGMPEGWGNKIMHCSFALGETRVMASDGMSAESSPFSGVTLSISADSTEDATRYFNALADGGQVQMPLAETFWSPCFGMLSDKFGVNWMVGVHPQEG